MAKWQEHALATPITQRDLSEDDFSIDDAVDAWARIADDSPPPPPTPAKEAPDSPSSPESARG